MAIMNTGIWHSNFNLFPPTLFVCLNRNGDLCAHNDETMAKMKKKNIPCKQVTSDPVPLTTEFFYEKGGSVFLLCWLLVFNVSKSLRDRYDSE